HDPPLAEQPPAIDLAKLVLVDSERAHLEALAGAVIRHFEPLRAGPGTVALDADRRVRKHVAEHRRIAVFVLIVLADALLEAPHSLEDRGLARDAPARELELGIVGEHFDEAVEVVVVERKEVARHEVLDRGAVGRILVVVRLNTHAFSFSCRAISAAWTGLRDSLAKVCLYS